MNMARRLGVPVALGVSLLLCACAQSDRPQQPSASVPRTEILATQPATPPAKKPAVGMVEVGGGVFCSASIMEKPKQTWARLGAHPYSGTTEEALARFTEVPKAVRDAWLVQTKGSRGMWGVLKKGDRVCSMMYSVDDKHRRWDNIEVALDDHPELRTVVFTVAHGGFVYELGIPPKRTGGCDNWFWRATRVKTTS